jgi:1-phosphatidylinositol-4-phosphate 5-kinase
LALQPSQEYDQGVLLRQNVLTPADADFITKRLFKWGAKPAPEQQQHGKKRVNQLGQVVFKGHPAFDLMSQLQLGIRWSVEKGEEGGAPRQLGFAECKQKSKVWFPRAGSATTPVHFSPDFKWKDYAPQVFRCVDGGTPSTTDWKHFSLMSAATIRCSCM